MERFSLLCVHLTLHTKFNSNFIISYEDFILKQNNEFQAEFIKHIFPDLQILCWYSYIYVL